MQPIFLERSNRILIRDIVHEDDAVGVPIVNLAKVPISFLPARVP